MKVLVVGGGKVGFYLTKTLLEHGHEPKLIEKNKRVCEHLADELDFPVINGDGSTIECLELAQADECEAVVSVTGQDQDNLICCQLAKQLFSVPKTVARVNNPKNLEIMKKLGVDIPISTTNNIARLLEREIDTAAIRQLIALNRGEASLCELQVPKNYKLDGIRLSELNLPEGSIIVSITRDGNLIIPRGNTQILSEDKIIIIVQDQIIHELNRILHLDLSKK